MVPLLAFQHHCSRSWQNAASIQVHLNDTPRVVCCSNRSSEKRVNTQSGIRWSYLNKKYITVTRATRALEWYYFNRYPITFNSCQEHRASRVTLASRACLSQFPKDHSIPRYSTAITMRVVPEYSPNLGEHSGSSLEPVRQLSGPSKFLLRAHALHTPLKSDSSNRHIMFPLLERREIQLHK